MCYLLSGCTKTENKKEENSSNIQKENVTDDEKLSDNQKENITDNHEPSENETDNTEPSDKSELEDTNREIFLLYTNREMKRNITPMSA